MAGLNCQDILDLDRLVIGDLSPVLLLCAACQRPQGHLEGVQPMDHFWVGDIDGRHVRIEWSDVKL